ncbi:PilN domain-containing protein [Cupriavidus pauculus]|uniref:PilN domain-containing protein n=1 Tax=Cupriavidus pauculus TaxID=82633 RepID=UPI001EE18341|nr:PilN domain-containing protein [Cupriavidus pauculus]GJG96671.1 hypothetical protein CBA19C6_19300 [Cupriavidus pauculus]
MRRLRIDFATGAGPRFVPTTAALVLIIAGVVGCGVALPGVLRLAQEHRTLDARLARVVERTRVVMAQQRQPVVSVSPEQVSAINRAVRRLNVPWRDLFDTLEQTTPQTVALLSLEPIAEQSVLKLSAEAATVDSMIEYVQRLKARPGIEAVRLDKHQVDEKDPYHPVRFSLALQWRYAAQPSLPVQPALTTSSTADSSREEMP